MVDINMHTDHADNINFPHARFAYGMSLFQCMTLSLYAEGGEGMGAAWGQEKAAEMIRDAGFIDMKLSSQFSKVEMNFTFSKAAVEHGRLTE